MTNPFRDGMEAALARSEQLSEENETLRDEVEQLRRAADLLRSKAEAGHPPPPAPEAAPFELRQRSPEAGALADETLHVLDQLEAVSKPGSKVRMAPGQTFTGAERPLTATTPPTSATNTGDGILDATSLAKARSPSRVAARSNASTLWLVAGTVGFTFFFLGLAFGSCLH